MARIIKRSDMLPQERPSRQSPFKKTRGFRMFLEWLENVKKFGEIPPAEAFEFDLAADISPVLKGKDPLASAKTTILQVIENSFPDLPVKVTKRTGKIYVTSPEDAPNPDAEDRRGKHK